MMRIRSTLFKPAGPEIWVHIMGKFVHKVVCNKASQLHKKAS